MRRIDYKLIEDLVPDEATVLDLACGDGELLAELVREKRVRGSGVDISREAVEACVAKGLSVFHGDLDEGLADFGDASHDVVILSLSLQQLRRPRMIVREMVRVVKHGGRVALMDWDFETVAVTHPDRELTRRLLHWRCDHHSGDNWSGRRLLGYALAAGLRDLTVIPVTIVARDEAAALTGSMFRAAEVVRDGGAITPAEHDAWVGELKRQLTEGQFMASITYFIVRGRR